MQQPTVAYFSMEIALEPEMPTYSGGLGVLAGDTIRSAAELMPTISTTNSSTRLPPFTTVTGESSSM